MAVQSIVVAADVIVSFVFVVGLGRVEVDDVM